MPGGGNDDGSVDSVGIHARLIIVVHSNEGPVCDDTGNADITVGHLAGDEILNGGGVEELNVGKGEDFGQKGGCEEGLRFHIVSHVHVNRSRVDKHVQHASQQQNSPRPRKEPPDH